MNDERSSPVQIPPTASDVELLGRFEPVVRFTKGEQFYPASVEPYLRKCALWAHYPDGREEELVPEGELDVDSLVAPRSLPFGTVLFPKLVGPLNLLESAQALRSRAQRQQAADRFRGGVGRLARVGYAARILDALFSVSLLLRGRVPGATAAAAELVYRQALHEDEQYVYYGRVVHMSDWIVLQYWFFYYYNCWRSGFHGVNDHESDWEQILVFLYRTDDGQLVPRWAAYASHDFKGDDLRRRWDDSAELELVDGHPVVYAGAGSHASYFRPGEYQTDVGLPLPERLVKVRQSVANFWTRTLGQAVRLPEQATPFRIPFVDYARGDGLSIGPGQNREWTPVVLEPAPPWLDRYRGLWGLFARDPISGENAPGGPMYNRDGTVRGAWYDPLGFAGLDKVPPPPVERQLLLDWRADIVARQAEIESTIATRSPALQQMGAELRSMEGSPHLARRHNSLTETVKKLGEEVRGLRRELAENGVLLESVDRRLHHLRTGEEDPPRAHIRHLAKPASAAELRFSHAAELWAAISIGVLLIALVALFRFVPARVWLGVLILAAAFLLVESVFRGTYVQTVTAIAVTLALIALGILVAHFWSQMLLVGAVAVGAFVLLENVREVRR